MLGMQSTTELHPPCLTFINNAAENIFTCVASFLFGVTASDCISKSRITRSRKTSECFYGFGHTFGKLLSPGSCTNLYDQATGTRFFS